jgi:hypothetical protein
MKFGQVCYIGGLVVALFGVAMLVVNHLVVRSHVEDFYPPNPTVFFPIGIAMILVGGATTLAGVIFALGQDLR